jgi:hypothetical protein
MSNFFTESMPHASLLAYLFPDRLVGATKNPKSNQCMFEFQPAEKTDEFTYEDLRQQLYSKDSIIIGNALEMVIACGLVKRAVHDAIKKSQGQR